MAVIGAVSAGQKQRLENLTKLLGNFFDCEVDAINEHGSESLRFVKEGQVCTIDALHTMCDGTWFNVTYKS